MIPVQTAAERSSGSGGDFYGETRMTTAYEGETASSAMVDPYQSIMTVNAIDGTVIDRSLGY